MNIFARKPWLLIIAGYLLGMGALTVMIIIAVKNQPDWIELPPREQAGEAR